MKKSIGSGRGSIYNIILKTLQSGDKYGYEICKEVEEKTNGAYILKQPSLYSGLKRLEAQGDISSYWKDSALGGRRHYYSLTENGKTRIEQSNFNWQDARDDIVETLFEKSQLEETIENAKSDIDSLKSIAKTSKENQKDIDFVLQNTEDLANPDLKIEEDYEVKLNENNQSNDISQTEYYNSNVDDLFSLFKTVEETEGEADTQQDQKVAEKIENTSEEFDEDITKKEVTENNETEETADIEEAEELKNQSEERTEQLEDTEEEQLDLFSFLNSQRNDEQPDNKNDTEEPQQPETQETTNAFNDIEKNLQTVDYSKDEDLTGDTLTLQDKAFENVEEKEDAKIENIESTEETNKFEDIAQKDTENTGQDSETTEDRTVLLEKTNKDAMEEYRENHFSSNSFADNTVFEKPDNTFSNFESTNMSLNDFLGDEKQDYTTEDQNNTNEETEDGLEVQDDTEKYNGSLDYKNIFGDLVSSENNENTFDGKNQQDNNNSVFEQSNQQNSFENKNDFEEKPHVVFDDLPRDNDALNNINYTLMTNNNSETQKQTESRYEPYETSTFEKYDNPFEKYDTYEPIEESKQVNFDNNIKQSHNYEAELYQNNMQRNEMAFDKKYANSHNKFEVPDYEIRYSQKNDVDNTSLRFISINKLNLFNSFVISFLICLCTALTMIFTLSKVTISTFQMFLFITSFVFALLHLLYNFLKYISNKNKKIHSIKKVELSNILFISIFFVILTVAINLFMGINFENIANFSASFFLPLIYVIILAFNNAFKRFLSRFKNFYN